MLCEPEVKCALDQPVLFERVEHVEQRAVGGFVPLELVAQLCLADVEAGAVDPGEDLLLEPAGTWR